MTAIVEPLAKRIAAIEGDYNRANAEDASADARDRAWGQGKEIIPSSDPNDVKMNAHPYFQDLPTTREAEEANRAIPPFIERIFRQIHQIPDNLTITHHKVTDDLFQMNRWFEFFFLPNLDYDVEIDYSSERLPSLIEEDIARDYKEWYETGEKVPTAPSSRPVTQTRTLRPPAPSTVNPLGSNAPAYTGAAGTGRANVKVAGKGDQLTSTAKVQTPVRVPSQPPIASLQEFPPMVSDWSMPDGHQSGDGFDAAKNTITIDSSSDNDAGGGWLTTPPHNRKA